MLQVIQDIVAGRWFMNGAFQVPFSKEEHGGLTNEDDIAGENDVGNGVLELVREYIDEVVSKKDVPVIKSKETDLPLTETARWILRIFEQELSLFDDRKSHYEREVILASMETNSSLLLEEISKLTDINENFEYYVNLFEKFSNYIEFTKSRYRKDNTVSKSSYYEPYSKLYEIELILDPESWNCDHKTFKDCVSEYYKAVGDRFSSIDLTAKSEISNDDIKRIWSIDLYIYFAYVKNYKYPETKHYQAFKKLTTIFDGFYKQDLSLSENTIDNIIHQTNKTFFFNYLASTLASALGKDESIMNLTSDEIKCIINDLKSKIEEYNIECSYFTYYKIARINWAFSKVLLQKWNIGESEKYLHTAKDELTIARRLYNTVGGTILKFYPDQRIIDDSGIFSLTGFLTLNSIDFNTRSFSLEFDISETLNKIWESKVRIEIEDAKNQMKSTEEKVSKHNIEILSIFAAIVIFTSGSIQIFQYVSSIKIAIVAMVWFAASLTLFALLLRWDYRVVHINTWSCKDFCKKNILLVSIIVITLTCTIYLFCVDDSVITNEKFIDHMKEEVRKDLNVKGDSTIMNVTTNQSKY